MAAAAPHGRNSIHTVGLRCAFERRFREELRGVDASAPPLLTNPRRRRVRPAASARRPRGVDASGPRRRREEEAASSQVDLAGSCEYLGLMAGPAPHNTKQGRAPAVGRAPGVAHFEEIPNLYFHRTDLLAVLKTGQNPRGDQCLKEKVLGAALIMLDTHHFPETTPFEYEFVELLAKGGFRGLLLLDDIHLNGEMKRFWAWFTEKRAPGSYSTKDATPVGHVSGTGWVDFSTNRPAGGGGVDFST
mmetsp:Transcript_10720/g.33058  ORF Transcript_10720/g.33058 Transcript_10720/m.33058 type:complete len:246 (-) Transcript_10720:260-997(-)